MASPQDTFDELADAFAACCRRGDAPSIEAYAARHPHLADEIRELFPVIQQVESTKSAAGGFSGDGWPASGQLAGRLGDFRIIREIGRGGMGVVYEAEQESLGRRVAIKVLPGHRVADPAMQRRFDREARTAAHLHHTNIVPIFGIGEHDGHPYFVMPIIRGVALDRLFHAVATRLPVGDDAGDGGNGDEDSGTRLIGTTDLVQLVRSLVEGASSDDAAPASPAPTAPTRTKRYRASAAPTADPTTASGAATDGDGRPGVTAPRRLSAGYWRSLARLVAGAADALAYAHDQGVLHRDIKPANLLLDAEGTLWVADFGLAKVSDHDALTTAGDVIGTVRYMAPEQFSGAVEPRSDVYGLGITLFEMATLVPAFPQGSGGSVMRAILDHRLAVPRELQPALPRDLETIILKATARQPDDRYRSAAALRDDLHRFVDDLPVHARRISPVERAWRWSRRRPWLALTTTLVFLLLATTAIVASIAYVKVRQANVRTKAALAGETRQRQRAETTTDLAVDTLDFVLDEFAPAINLASTTLGDSTDESFTVDVDIPAVVTPATADLLQQLLEVYTRLAAGSGDAPELRRKAATANRRVGEIHQRLGQAAAATHAYEQAIELYESLRAVDPDDADATLQLAITHNTIGQLWVELGDMPASIGHLLQALGLLNGWIGGGAALDRQAVYERARAHYLLARAPGDQLPVSNQPPDHGPGRPGRSGERLPPPRRRNAERPPRPGLSPDRGFPDGEPRDGGPPEGRPADGRPPGGGPPGGRPGAHRPGRRGHLAQAIEALEGLVAAHPAVPQYRHLLALCLREPVDGGRRDGAGGAPTEHTAEQLLEELVADHPEVARFRFDLAETYVRDQRGPGAAERLAKSVQIIEALHAEWPQVPAYEFALARMHFLSSQLHARGGQHEQEIEALRSAVTIQADLADRFPEVAPFVITAGFYESVLANQLLGRDGDREIAGAVLTRAITRLTGLADHDSPQRRNLLRRCYEQLSRLRQQLGDAAGARAARRQARALGGDRPPPGGGPGPRPPRPGPRRPRR